MPEFRFFRQPGQVRHLGPPPRDNKELLLWAKNVHEMLTSPGDTHVKFIALKLTPAAVNAATTSEQTFNVPGINGQLDQVTVSKPTHTAGIVIGSARVVGNNSVAIQFANTTAGNLTPPVEVYTFTVLREMKPR